MVGERERSRETKKLTKKQIFKKLKEGTTPVLSCPPPPPAVMAEEDVSHFLGNSNNASPATTTKRKQEQKEKSIHQSLLPLLDLQHRESPSSSTLGRVPIPLERDAGSLTGGGAGRFHPYPPPPSQDNRNLLNHNQSNLDETAADNLIRPLMEPSTSPPPPPPNFSSAQSSNHPKPKLKPSSIHALLNSTGGSLPSPLLKINATISKAHVLPFLPLPPSSVRKQNNPLQSFLNQDRKDSFKYQVSILQNPERGRMSGLSDSVNRRLLDPALVVEINPTFIPTTPSDSNNDHTPPHTASAGSSLTDTPANYNSIDQRWNSQTSQALYLANHASSIIANCALISEEKDAVTQCILQPSKKNKPLNLLLGPSSMSAQLLMDANRVSKLMFVFSELGVRIQGRFRISVTVINMETFQMDRVFTEPFEIYPPQSFPGLLPVTDLSKVLYMQGISLRSGIYSKKAGVNAEIKPPNRLSNDEDES